MPNFIGDEDVIICPFCGHTESIEIGWSTHMCPGVHRDILRKNLEQRIRARHRQLENERIQKQARLFERTELLTDAEAYILAGGMLIPGIIEEEDFE